MKPLATKLKTSMTMVGMEITNYRLITSLTFSLNFASIKTLVSLATLKLRNLNYIISFRLTSILNLIRALRSSLLTYIS
jgi:hypothetical protein